MPSSWLYGLHIVTQKGYYCQRILFWLLIWLGISVIVLLPRLTEYLAKFLGVGRGVDAILYISVIGLVYALFRVMMKIEHLEQEITTIVRELALRKETDKKE
ncbi:MAG: DUF2304 domain-containing protein [Candidatus Nomurabacteria bacterium]|nr:MAG: DUF2304 domain-containing protein [Candidatus Nomurabacteria bacterium]